MPFLLPAGGSANRLVLRRRSARQSLAHQEQIQQRATANHPAHIHFQRIQLVRRQPRRVAAFPIYGTRNFNKKPNFVVFLASLNVRLFVASEGSGFVHLPQPPPRQWESGDPRPLGISKRDGNVVFSTLGRRDFSGR
jgi:hypothetical protein